MTPVTTSIKRRQNNKKSKLLRIAEEKKKQEKIEDDNRVVIPVRHRLRTIKLPVAAHLDVGSDSCHIDEVEQEFIDLTYLKREISG